MNKLASLMWESIPSDNLIIKGSSKLEAKNLDDLPIGLLEELYISRDENYDIKVSCAKRIDWLSDQKTFRKNEKEFVPGETITPGELAVRPIGEVCSFVLAPCYFKGYTSTLERVEYQLSCSHVECKYSEEKSAVLKEWFLNGSQSGLCFCDNRKYEYTVEETVSGKYGDLYFPVKTTLEMQERFGRFVHIKFKDTAFDVHYVERGYGPEWSENISISYFEKYGRIPSSAERILIRDYLSFVTGKRLIYIGNSKFDDNGYLLGFEMESPVTYGFEIKRICKNAAMPPICDRFDSLQTYFEFVQEYIGPFEDLYNKLEFNAFFRAYWYAKSIAKPYDLPILSGALEYLMTVWYKQVDLKQEAVYIDKKVFQNRIKPIKKLVEEQFKDTGYAGKMQQSIDNINNMSINDKRKNFFSKIGMPIGESEKNALNARNSSAHGSFREKVDDFELLINSKVYECIIVRTVLVLLGYTGKYVDYGMLGYPEKDITMPSGDPLC